MIRRLLILCMLLSCFWAPGATAENLQEITVKDGDTLWSVANYYLKDPQRWPDILKYNKLPSSDTNVILPGMKLQVPTILIKEHLRAARLISILKDVRVRRNAQSDWQKALQDMELYNEDGLRTLAESKAKVRFASGELLQVDENSLIILKPEKSREEIDLIAGGVRASKTKILSSSSLIAPRIEPRGTTPDFRTKLKKDKTTLVEVYEGIVDVTAQGKTVTVTKGFGTEVKFQQTPSLPRILPPQPRMRTAVAETSSGPAMVSQLSSMKISVPAPETTPSLADSNDKSDASKVLGQIITKYRIQIAASTAFALLLADEVKSLQSAADISFKNYRLPDGEYFYRIAYIDDLGFESAFSAPVPFSVDTTPPSVTIATPGDQEEVDTEFIQIEGTTEPGLTFKINDKQVQSDEKGKFVTALMGTQGKNVLTITARDRAENTTVKELTVYKVKTKTAEKSTRISQTVKEKSSTLASIALATLTAVVIVGVLVLIVH